MSEAKSFWEWLSYFLGALASIVTIIAYFKSKEAAMNFCSLFYSCLSDHGKEKFKPLVEEHNLLKDMSRKNLLEEDHLELYSGIEFENDISW